MGIGDVRLSVAWTLGQCNMFWIICIDDFKALVYRISEYIERCGDPITRLLNSDALQTSPTVKVCGLIGNWWHYWHWHVIFSWHCLFVHVFSRATDLFLVRLGPWDHPGGRASRCVPALNNTSTIDHVYSSITSHFQSWNWVQTESQETFLHVVTWV